MKFADKIANMFNTHQQEFPTFKSGDTITVHVKVKEGEKERIQLFKGVVIKVQGSGVGRTFTVRKMSSGVGVERTWPFASPSIDKVEVQSIGKVRRSRLFYLRELRGRAAKIKSELVTQKKKEKKPKADKKKAAAPKADAPKTEEAPAVVPPQAKATDSTSTTNPA